MNAKVSAIPKSKPQKEDKSKSCIKIREKEKKLKQNLRMKAWNGLNNDR